MMKNTLLAWAQNPSPVVVRGSVLFRLIGKSVQDTVGLCHVGEFQTQKGRPLSSAQATAVTSRHVCMAEARKARCVLAEMRWR